MTIEDLHDANDYINEVVAAAQRCVGEDIQDILLLLGMTTTVVFSKIHPTDQQRTLDTWIKTLRKTVAMQQQ